MAIADKAIHLISEAFYSKAITPRRRLRVTVFLISMFCASLAVGQNLSSSSFTTSTGAFSSAISESNHNSNSETLVLFWAQWCDPCKDELRFVAKRQTELAKIHLVAVSIDSKTEWLDAERFLQSIGWHGDQLFDEDGRWFSANVRTDGALPSALLANSESQVVDKFSGINSAVVEQLLNRTPASYGNAQKGFSFQGKSEYVNNSSIHAGAYAWSYQGKYDSETWSVGATHDVLRQQRAGNSWDRYQDELGDAWIGYRSQDSAHNNRWAIRLGDDEVNALSGLLVSMRQSVETNEATSLRGGHLACESATFSGSLKYGVVRQKLYPGILDPSKDIAAEITETKALVGTTRLMSNNIGWLEVGAARISEKEKFQDQAVRRELSRMGASLKSDLSKVGFEASGVCFNGEKSIGVEDCKTQYAAVQKMTMAGQNGVWAAAIQGVETSSIGKYARTPTVYDVPFTPLEGERMKDLGLKLDIVPSPSGMMTIKSILSTLADTPKTERRLVSAHYSDVLFADDVHYGLLVGHQQDHINSRDSEVSIQKENTARAKLGITRLVQGEALVHYRPDGDQHNGRSDTLRGDVNILGFFKSGLSEEFNMGYAHTRQSGTYVGESGIDRGVMKAVSASFSFAKGEFTMIRGQQAGGKVCSSGSCYWQPPLDGMRMVGSVFLAI